MPVAANLDDASGLRLRFSCEILSSLIPRLITITVKGKCSDPLNYEETVFSLNLLYRIVNFLVEPAFLIIFLAVAMKSMCPVSHLIREENK